MHNNYLTLPVVFAMLSNHFPFTYGHAHAWLILVALMAIGAWIRHYFNLRHRGPERRGGSSRRAAAGIARARDADPADGARVGRAGRPPALRAGAGDRRSSAARPATRCSPTEPGYASPPAGIVLDTRGADRARARR